MTTVNVTNNPVRVTIALAGVQGRGVPAGGTAGQVLAKVDGVDFNTGWVDQTGGGADLSDAAPQALGTAAAGTGTAASRDDHVHEMPDASDISIENTFGIEAEPNVQAFFDFFITAFGTIGTAAFQPVEAFVAAGTLTQILTEASAFTAVPATHASSAGRERYIRAGGNVTFNSSQGYTAGEKYIIRATAGLTLVGTGVTLTPMATGTLDLDAAMAVTVIMTSATTADVYGQAVAA